MLNDRENILSALREKRLKVEIMKRANIVKEETRQTLLWGHDYEALDSSIVQTVVPAGIPATQLRVYVLFLQIIEAVRVPWSRFIWRVQARYRFIRSYAMLVWRWLLLVRQRSRLAHRRAERVHLAVRKSLLMVKMRLEAAPQFLSAHTGGQSRIKSKMKRAYGIAGNVGWRAKS